MSEDTNQVDDHITALDLFGLDHYERSVAERINGVQDKVNNNYNIFTSYSDFVSRRFNSLERYTEHIHGENLIKNWHLFDPINQNGESSYTYLTTDNLENRKFDYWSINEAFVPSNKSQDGKTILSLNDGYIRLSYNGANSYGRFSYRWYGNLIKKSNNFVFSIIYRSNSDRNCVHVNIGNREAGVYSNEKILLEKSDDFTLYFKGINILYDYIPGLSSTRDLLYFEIHDDIDIMAIKLEFGNVSTLARYLDGNLVILDTYNPVTELYNAMQYYEIIYTQQEKYYIQFKVPKIKIPSIYFYDYNGNVVVNAVATDVTRFGFRLGSVTVYKVIVDAR